MPANRHYWHLLKGPDSKSRSIGRAVTANSCLPAPNLFSGNVSGHLIGKHVLFEEPFLARRPLQGASRRKFSSSQEIAVEPAERIRRATINRVKSEQAIRRSASLLKGTKKLIEHKTHAPQPSAARTNVAPKPSEVMRQEARIVREHSRQAIEKSRAARQRNMVLGNKPSSREH